jgi:hypothetical protein
MAHHTRRRDELPGCGRVAGRRSRAWIATTADALPDLLGEVEDGDEREALDAGGSRF